MGCTVIKYPQNIATTPPPGTSASPGFQYGRAGLVNAGTYLQVIANIPSSTAGNIVPFTGTLTRAFVTCESNATFTVKVQTRTDPGPVFTDITTLTVTGARRGDFALSNQLTDGDELVVIIDTGSCTNVQVGLIIEQN